MNALNGIVTKIFDVALWPFELMGASVALVLASGVFGVLALLVFKHISWQAGIAAAKDQIKGHLIEIRIYQDDLLVVGKAIVMILLKNLKYVALNFGPFIPLMIPFLFVVSQAVTRYAFTGIPTSSAEGRLAGEGSLIEVVMAPGHEDEVKGLRIVLPETLEATSRLFRYSGGGEAIASQEVVATGSGVGEIEVVLADGTSVTKTVVTGDAEMPRRFQPFRTSVLDVWDAEYSPLLWPAEPAFEADSPFRRISLIHPDREQPWLPDGLLGTLVTVIVASMLFGFLALKPLGVQI